MLAAALAAAVGATLADVLAAADGAVLAELLEHAPKAMVASRASAAMRFGLVIKSSILLDDRVSGHAVRFEPVLPV
jgi:hypothetical protein